MRYLEKDLLNYSKFQGSKLRKQLLAFENPGCKDKSIMPSILELGHGFYL